MSTLVINCTIKSIASLRDLPRCCHCCSARGYIVAEVVAVCAAPCVQFGGFNAFSFAFSKRAVPRNACTATTVTRGTMELTGGSAIFYGWKYPLFHSS